MITKESSGSESIEYKTDDNTLSKTLSIKNYLDEKNNLKKLKSPASSCKINFILGLYYY